MRNVRVLTTILVLGLSGLLAACGDEGAADDGAAESEAGSGGAITLEMHDMYFEPDAVEVAAGEPVTFELVNEGDAEHNLVFDGGPESDNVAPGDTVTFDAGAFDEDAVGWCSIPGHREAGMELDVNVVE